MKSLMVGVVVLLASHAIMAQAPSPPPPLVKPEGLKAISQHVQVIPDNSVPLVPNIGYIVGDKAVLVIDTGLGPRNGAAVFTAAQKLAGSRQIYLAVTHVHPEHDLGAQAAITARPLRQALEGALHLGTQRPGGASTSAPVGRRQRQRTQKLAQPFNADGLHDAATQQMSTQAA